MTLIQGLLLTLAPQAPLPPPVPHVPTFAFKLSGSC